MRQKQPSHDQQQYQSEADEGAAARVGRFGFIRRSVTHELFVTKGTRHQVWFDEYSWRGNRCSEVVSAVLIGTTG